LEGQNGGQTGSFGLGPFRTLFFGLLFDLTVFFSHEIPKLGLKITSEFQILHDFVILGNCTFLVFKKVFTFSFVFSVTIKLTLPFLQISDLFLQSLTRQRQCRVIGRANGLS